MAVSNPSVTPAIQRGYSRRGTEPLLRSHPEFIETTGLPAHRDNLGCDEHLGLVVGGLLVRSLTGRQESRSIAACHPQCSHPTIAFPTRCEWHRTQRLSQYEALMIGRTISQYKITAKLGEGGMGAVYQATDTRLGREVALKILPEQFVRDRHRMVGFQREAEVLASLNHPNISTIHGLEESRDVRALVLELVEGPTLAEKITEGPIPVEEALQIALEIAQALEVLPSWLTNQWTAYVWSILATMVAMIVGSSLLNGDEGREPVPPEAAGWLSRSRENLPGVMPSPFHGSMHAVPWWALPGLWAAIVLTVALLLVFYVFW